MTALRRYNAKRDANEPAIVNVFRDMGCLVHRLDTPVDLLVKVYKAVRDTIVLVEVKLPGKDLNDTQRKFVDAGWPVHVIRSEDEAINLVKRLRGA